MQLYKIGIAAVASASLLACAPPGQGNMGFRDIDWPRADQIMTASDNREIEVLLNQLGYLPGGVDGQIGRDTRSAIRAYQGDIGAPVTGYISRPLLLSLRANAPVDAAIPASALGAPAAAAEPRASNLSTSITPTTSTSNANSGATTRSISDDEDDDDESGGLGGGSGGAWN